MAITKRVIVLEQLSNAALTIRYVMWADVPLARQPMYANLQAAMTSQWINASAADNLALQSGAVSEKVDTQIFGPGTTLAQAEAILQANWQQFQAEVNAKNPWVRYGSVMDTSNVWTLTGIA